MSALDLATSGVVLFSRFGNVLAQRPISRDPLSGVLDGTNRFFHTNFSPILTAGSLGIRVGQDPASGTADYATGEIELDEPPVVQPLASYTFTPYTPLQIMQFLFAGFSEMELRWQRGFRLVTSGGLPASELSSESLLVDVDGNDPPFGSTSFSLSATQIGLLMLSAEYRMYAAEAGNAAINDFSFREQLRGMAVDKSKRPSNLEAVLKRLEGRLATALDLAWTEYNGSDAGVWIDNPVTMDFARNFAWTEAAKEFNNAGWLPYNYSLRNF